MLPRHFPGHGSSPSAGPSSSASASVSNSANFYLGLLVAQNTAKTLILRYAVSGKPEFLYSAAVLATESLKALLSVLWVLSHGGSLQGIVAFLLDEWRIFVRVLVPAGVYNCQQMLEFVALSRLDAPVYSVLVQSKLLTTALFSYFLLRKQLARKQIVALLLLLCGVALAQISQRKPVPAAAGGAGGSASTAALASRASAVEVESSHQRFVGVLATLIIATLSGFAAVYTEGVLKREGSAQHPDRHPHARGNHSLAYMQIQMALASLLLIGAFALVQDFAVIVEFGLWHGFNNAALVAVFSSALGGLIVSAVLKYADSVLKVRATSA